jgi:alpha-L-fucosidase
MKYEETWNSLKRHRTPEWLDDGKFGIYFHWGIYSFPAFGNEWYPNHMYGGGLCYPHHAETYGEPDEYGYKEFIPKFTAENYNAEEWAKIFKETGAKFAGPVAEHHDGFSLWDSKVNKWNAKNMGPKRDIVGELEKAIKGQDLKFITTFHHSHNWYYYQHYEGLDTYDPEFSGLYGKPHAKEGASDSYTDRPDKEFCEIWFAKLKEVIDGYTPDLIWFDFGLMRIPDKYKRKMAAYYYNAAEEWGREVEIIYKDNHLPPKVGLLDYERGRSDKMTWHSWITDTTMGTKSWSYIKDEEFKPPGVLIHNYVDRIAKNGYLLLNFGPTAQGDIPDEVRFRLKEMGDWMKINEEAVYNCTPWVLAEEGPTNLEKGGGFCERNKVNYTSEDLRFVAKNNALYVFAMGWPGKELQIKSLTLPPTAPRPINFYLIEDSDIKSIHLLGNEGALKWKLTTEGLKIELPEEKPCKYAFTFKIQWT